MSRIPVKKTYKLYIGGKFPRTESGRYYPVNTADGNLLANLCLASRKDVRNAVVAARKAQAGWAGATAYLRSQILYRIAEMLEGRRGQSIDELSQLGGTRREAEREVDQAIDLWVYFAGWSDKYIQVFSSVNPVASPHFNFSMPEPTGVVAVCAPEGSGLLGLVGAVAPVLCGGNTAVCLASREKGTVAISFAEVLNDSDLPGGVLNLLTGDREELLPHLSSHMDINGIAYYGEDAALKKQIQENAALNVRRVSLYESVAEDPYRILDFSETKTTWHPVGVGAGGGGAY